MDNFLMRPKIDFAFKEIMNDEKARVGFLAAVLHLDPTTIKATQILNPFLRKTHEDDKLGIMDVRILMNDDTEIDTEIQLSKLKVWAERSLFYASKMYADQIEPGQKYSVFKKCVNIRTEDSSSIELWAKFINAEKTEEFDMIAEKDPYIKSAYNQLQMVSQDKQKRMGSARKGDLGLQSIHI